MLTNGYLQYQRTQAETAGRGDLVVMLYEGAIAAIGRACAHLDRREFDRAHAQLVRAQDILWELCSSLDLRVGDIAERLQALYLYMLDRLVAANVAKDAAPAGEVARLLQELLPAWREAARTVQAQQVTPLVPAGATA